MPGIVKFKERQMNPVTSIGYNLLRVDFEKNLAQRGGSYDVDRRTKISLDGNNNSHFFHDIKIKSVPYGGNLRSRLFTAHLAIFLLALTQG